MRSNTKSISIYIPIDVKARIQEYIAQKQYKGFQLMNSNNISQKISTRLMSIGVNTMSLFYIKNTDGEECRTILKNDNIFVSLFMSLFVIESSLIINENDQAAALSQYYTTILEEINGLRTHITNLYDSLILYVDDSESLYFLDEYLKFMNTVINETESMIIQELP